MKQTLLIITSLMLVVGFSDAQTYKGMRFNDDGSKSFETYKESKGKLELVKKVSWYSNGQKESEGTFKDGLKDRKWTYWDENGQKRYEETWKGGKLVGVTKVLQKTHAYFSSPTAVVETWFSAGAAGDKDLLSKCLSSNAPGEFDVIRNKSASAEQYDEFSKQVKEEDPKVTGVEMRGENEAIVFVKFASGGDESIRVEKSGDGWLIVDY